MSEEINSKRDEILDQACFRAVNTKRGWAVRGPKNSISARAIADHTGFRIQYVCGVLQEGIEDGSVQRLGTRYKYTYCNAEA